MTLVRHDIRPADIVTRNSLENAIASVSATGGSTNAALHLPAIAAEFGMTLTLDEFTEVADRTPLIADMRPGGQYAAADMYNAGGVGLVMRELLKAGLLHGDETTVDGRTIAKVAADTVESRGPAGRPNDRQPDQADRRDHRAQGQPRARRVRPEARRRGAAPAPRTGARVRLRVRVLRGGQPAEDRRGRCGRHPLRGPGRRPGDAGDARRHGRARGRGPRPVGRPADRRAVLGRDPRADDRPRVARRRRSAARSR